MEIKATPNLAHNVQMNQQMLDVLTTLPVREINNTESINKMALHLDPVVMKQGAPALIQPPAQLNRSYEISNDPPTTVMKFTDPETKQVIMQVPNEASIRAYQGIQEFLKKQDEINKAAVKIVI